MEGKNSSPPGPKFLLYYSFKSTNREKPLSKKKQIELRAFIESIESPEIKTAVVLLIHEFCRETGEKSASFASQESDDVYVRVSDAPPKLQHILYKFSKTGRLAD